MPETVSIQSPGYTKILRKALEHHGHLFQMIKAMEEAAEFIQAVSKMAIGEPGAPLPSLKQLRANVLEESVDLRVMLDQMDMIMKFSVEERMDVLDAKVSRLKQRLQDAGVDI